MIRNMIQWHAKANDVYAFRRVNGVDFAMNFVLIKAGVVCAIVSCLTPAYWTFAWQC